MKRIVSLLLSLTMAFSLPMTSMAAEPKVQNSEKVATIAASDTGVLQNDKETVGGPKNEELRIGSNGQISKITFNYISDDLVEVRVIESGQADLILTANKKAGIVTGKNGATIQIVKEEENAVTNRTPYQSETKTYNCTCADIKNLLGGTATVAGVAGVIIAIITAAGFSVPEALPTLTTHLSGILGLVAFIMDGSTDHGISVQMQSYLKTLHHGGDTYTVEAWKITGATTY